MLVLLLFLIYPIYISYILYTLSYILFLLNAVMVKRKVYYTKYFASKIDKLYANISPVNVLLEERLFLLLSLDCIITFIVSTIG